MSTFNIKHTVRKGWQFLSNPIENLGGWLGVSIPLALYAVIRSYPNPNPLFLGILVYAGYYFLGFRLLVQPYLKRTTGGTDRDKELPYLLIPFVIVNFLLFIYIVGGDYFTHGAFTKGFRFSFPFAVFLLSIAASFYYGFLLPKVFFHSFHQRSIVKPLTPIRTAAFILPAILGFLAFIWVFAYVIFVLVFSFYDPSIGSYDMALSSSWIGILVYFSILGILNFIWLRPYLLRTKGRISRDDQLPYFIIPTLISVLSVFLFDVYRYSLGAILPEHLRFSFTVLICSATILWYTGRVLPRSYHFSFQEFAFTKPLSWDVLTGIHAATFFLLFVLIGALTISFGM